MPRDIVLAAVGREVEPTLAEARESLWSLKERNWLAEDDLAAALALLERQRL